MEELVEVLGTGSLVLLGVLVSQFIIKRYFKKIDILKKPFGLIRKNHKYVGMIFVIVAGVHGMLTGQFFTLNFGTAAWVVGVLIWLTYYLRKPLKKNWLLIHRILAILIVIFVGIHLMIVD